jgi:hypothetical protein
MHARTVCLLFAILTGCGGGKSKTDGSGGTGSGGTGGSAAGGAGGTDPCANLACLQHVNDLMVECTVGGSCVSQRNSVSFPMTNAICYDNGVRIMDTQMSSVVQANMTDTFEVKKGDMLCYTRTFVSFDPPNYAVDSVMMDASGTTLVTTHKDINNVYTVTCPGRPPTKFTTSCGLPDTVVTNGYLVPAGSPLCTDGTCIF